MSALSETVTRKLIANLDEQNKHLTYKVLELSNALTRSINNHDKLLAYCKEIKVQLQNSHPKKRLKKNQIFKN